jgi:hypothetical protein
LKLALLLSAVAAAIGVTALWAVGDNPRDADDTAQPTFITAASIKSAFAAHGDSKADWVAMHPQLWWRQIQMICNVSEADARRYEQQLGPTFLASVLERLRSDCNS